MNSQEMLSKRFIKNNKIFGKFIKIRNGEKNEPKI